MLTATKETQLMQRLKRGFIISWALGCIFYLLQYAVRSSPAVMLGELSDSFGLSTFQMSSILGTYYYSYAIVSLIAGVAYDKFGAKYPIAIGAGLICLGCLLFSLSGEVTGNAGRLLQGAGSAFSFTGCVYLASHGFSAKYIATAIGFTQCMGMLGGSSGQFITGPLIENGLPVHLFWIVMGAACGIICLLLLLTTPKEVREPNTTHTSDSFITPYKIVFSNLQSYLSGIISGLLFVPTTVFAMTWGISFLVTDRGMDRHAAVLASAMVPMGWVIGCPLLGFISDKIGRRKPVLIGGSLVMILCFLQLFFMPQLMAPLVSMLIFGIASGAAMIPYTMIKEANPDEVKGSATGGINFITFGVTSCLGPVFAAYHGKTLANSAAHEAHFQAAGIFLIAVIVVALIVSLFIKETGKTVRT
ncbi:MFS transporter [Pedobacter duraquae]|uniref:Lysosomal dipeptide transporter MFSD1 n=1 Tax=Pedobacter duraquae TaxID=425511 RepID=A0A4R6IFH2_9SPHI|nr:MFS transporter [Pedobacter duraquae]TDO20774.1 sugar phosphate permease [Pedobacter duraquae]